MKIDPAEWEAWKTAKGTKDRHSATAVLSNWSKRDYQGAGKWLDTIPDSSIKTDMIGEYAWNIASIAPELAAGYLPQIPEGQSRKNIIDKIAAAFEAKDPAAATAFRAENQPSD